MILNTLGFGRYWRMAAAKSVIRQVIDGELIDLLIVKLGDAVDTC